MMYRARFSFKAAILSFGTALFLSGCGPSGEERGATDSGAPAPQVGAPLGTQQGPDSTGNQSNPLSSAAPPPAEPPVVPAWMATALDSPDVRVRLKALETWGQSAPTGSVDPLMLAMDDPDERVQARALELIAQDWARAQEAKPLP